LALSPDGQILVSGSEDGTIKMYDIKEQKELQKFVELHTDKVKSVAVSPDGKFLVSGSDDKSIKIFNVENKTFVHSIQDAHKGYCRRCCR